jgi:hypothetical protein
MKVRELIDLLAYRDPEFEVILQKDAEGNGYSPLAEVCGNAVYQADSTWSGEVKFQVLTPEMISQGYTEEDVDGGVPCVVLCPVN